MNTAQTQPADRDLRSSAIVAFGVGAVAVALVAVVALGGIGGRGSSDGGVVVPPPASSPWVPAATPSSEPSQAPATPKPTAKPVATPQPPVKPVATPRPEPTDGGTDAMPIRVDLRNVTGADIHVDIVDRTGLIVDAESGRPADGVSTDRLVVENLDRRTLKLTWSDYPIDNALALFVDRTGNGYRFLLIQPAPTGTTDSIAFDRELILKFSEPISASDVETFMQEGLDT
jgi:hypothetical protein